MRENYSLAILAAVVSGMALIPPAQASDAARTCAQLNLSPTAAGDCEQQLGAALTDADRAKVIHTFAVGLATAKADALVSQLTPSSSAAPAQPAGQAATAMKATKTSTQAPGAATPTPAPNEQLATPQEKATTAGGGPRTGTKAGAQHTETGADQSAPKPKPKAQKAAHQPADKTAKKTRP